MPVEGPFGDNGLGSGQPAQRCSPEGQYSLPDVSRCQLTIEPSTGHEYVHGNGKLEAGAQSESVGERAPEVLFRPFGEDVTPDVHDVHSVGPEQFDSFTYLEVKTCAARGRVEQ